MATAERLAPRIRSAATSRRPFVLMIAPGPFFVDRGFGVAVYEQARALTMQGIRVEVVCYHSGRDVDGLAIHRAAALPGYGAERVGPSLSRLPLWLLLLQRTMQVAAQTRPDLLHGHLHEGALIAGLVSRVLGIPWVFDFQGSLSLEMAEKSFLKLGSLPFRLVALGERQIDRLAPRLLVKSATMQRELEERFQVDESRITPVWDGTDPSVFSPRSPDPELRKRLGIEPDAVVIGFLGLLTAQQGVERLLRGMAKVLPEHPECRLLLLGYPTDRAEELARALDIRHRVTLTGRVDYFAAADYLALVDLAMAPKVSKTEGNGKVYNYMSMALPVVAMDSPGNRDILGDDGYYVQGDGPEELAAATMDALESRDEWAERGHRLRQRLEQDFTWTAVASRIATAYREVAPLEFERTSDRPLRT